jgi:hypothetical protein
MTNRFKFHSDLSSERAARLALFLRALAEGGPDSETAETSIYGARVGAVGRKRASVAPRQWRREQAQRHDRRAG